MGVKNKLIKCIAINMAKERYGDKSKSDEFLIEAEYLFKDLLLRVLAEKAKNDPLEYITFLENVEEICDWDFYDTFFVESLIFGE